MVVNELLKSIQREVILNNFLTYMLRKKNWNSQKIDYDMDFWKYGSFQAIQKPIKKMFKVFLTMFFASMFYF